MGCLKFLQRISTRCHSDCVLGHSLDDDALKDGCFQAIFNPDLGHVLLDILIMAFAPEVEK